MRIVLVDRFTMVNHENVLGMLCVADAIEQYHVCRVRLQLIAFFRDLTAAAICPTALPPHLSALQPCSTGNSPYWQVLSMSFNQLGARQNIHYTNILLSPRLVQSSGAC